MIRGSRNGLYTGRNGCARTSGVIVHRKREISAGLTQTVEVHASANGSALVSWILQYICGGTIDFVLTIRHTFVAYVVHAR